MSNSSWAPNESAWGIFLEQCVLDGTVAGSVVFGMLSMIALNCLRNLFKGRPLRQVQWGIVAYTIIIYSWATIYLGTWTKYVEMMFIDDRNYPGDPGGPLGFYENETPGIYVVVLVAYAIINFMADGLLMYRCYMVWNRKWWIMIVPVCMYLVSIALAILATFELVEPGAPYFSTTQASFTLPWYALSITLNLLLTALIAGKLLSARNKLRAVLGEAHAKLYTSITAMIVESAALYSFTSIIVISNYASFIASYSFLFLNVSYLVHAMVMTICPLLIISRVARGRAYSEEAITRGSTAFQFAKSNEGGPTSGATIALSSWNSGKQQPSTPGHQSTEFQISKHSEVDIV